MHVQRQSAFGENTSKNCEIKHIILSIAEVFLLSQSLLKAVNTF